VYLLCVWTGLTATYHEVRSQHTLQVIHYGVLEHYHGHFDYIPPGSDMIEGRHPYDNRLVTVLFYLNDVDQGGDAIQLYWCMLLTPYCWIWQGRRYSRKPIRTSDQVTATICLVMFRIRL
jgi:hypothetical protein